MEDEHENDFHLQVKGLSLIDFSSENDALVINSSSPLISTSDDFHHRQSTENESKLDVFESFGGSLSNEKEAALSPSSDQDDQLTDLNDSLEPDRARRKAKCNLRKSLAWDSAFFTSAGVLDPEELSCMIKGAEKNEKQILPGIQEDVRTSNDSISTLESDNLILENLEAGLFEDIRASIQKSSKAFTAKSVTCKATSGESQAVSSKKKMNTSSQNQKQQPALKKTVGISKSQTKQTLRTQGTVRATKQDAVYSQVAQPVVRTGDANLTLHKPPRLMNKGKPTPTATAKKASFAVSQANKIEHDKTTIGAVAGKGTQALKVPMVNGARRVLPKPESSSKASFNFSTSTKSVTSSLTDSSGSVSSDKICKSHLAPIQKKVGDRTVKPSPSGSTLKTPSKAATRIRTMSGNSAVSAYLMSSKISSTISPASSISEWSSASSSSSCTINLKSNKSRTSFDTSSCRSSENGTITSDLNDCSNSQMFGKHENEGINGSARRSSTQAGTLSRPASARPSGLRMPSPKIGFFDGVKSIRTPNGSMQSHASLTVSPKISAATDSPSRSSNMKPKVGKLSQTRTGSALGKTSQETTFPMPSGEKSHPSVNVYSATSSDVEGCPISSIEVNNEIIEENCLKAEEVGGEVFDQANRVDGVVSSKDNKIFAIGDNCDPNTEGKEILRPLKKVDRDGEENLASILPTVRVNEKENAVFREHVDEFSSILGHVNTNIHVDGVVSSKDNKIFAIGDNCDPNTEGKEILRPLNKVDRDGEENLASILPTVRVNEKENAVFREHVDEFSSILGHVNTNIHGLGDRNSNERQEPNSVSLSPSNLKKFLQQESECRQEL